MENTCITAARVIPLFGVSTGFTSSDHDAIISLSKDECSYFFNNLNGLQNIQHCK